MTRIDVDEARRLWVEAPDDELQELARRVRNRWHEPGRATYMVMRIINYTNVCVAQCDYCAFYVLPNQEGGYVLSREDVFAKIDELVEFGGDLVSHCVQLAISQLLLLKNERDRVRPVRSLFFKGLVH